MTNSSTRRFLVTDLVPSACIEDLQHLGFEVDHIEDMSNDELTKIIGNYTGLVIRTSLILDKSMIDRAVNLKYVLRPGSGMDNIDVPYAEAKGIKLFNSPEANSDAVAEHAIGLLLGLLNHIPRSFDQIKNGSWIRNENTGILLKGKTVGLIGYGHTGSAMAQKLSGFGCRIMVYDKYKRGFGGNGVEEAAMADIFENADVLSLHIPLNTETNHLINEDFISQFKKPFFLINTSRGKITDLKAAIAGLKSGKLLGAGLDVLENENFSSYSANDKKQLNDLWSSGNIIITPHIAGWTKESRNNIFYVVIDKFKAYLKGEK
jgi:D-3-phosphoglycerate dehydrogenase